jgi:hypothetical protein
MLSPANVRLNSRLTRLQGWMPFCHFAGEFKESYPLQAVFKAPAAFKADVIAASELFCPRQMLSRV